MRKALVLLLVVFLLLQPVTVSAEEGVVIGGTENDVWFTKYGNVNTSCTAEDFLGEMGFAWGDTVQVSFLDQVLVLPVVPDYSYVESGCAAVIVRQDEKGKPTENVSLAINMGNFAESYGLGKKHTEDDRWYWESERTFPVQVAFAPAEKEGYLAQYLLHQLVRTNEREDYSHLTDGEFANFRPIWSRKLYRTSSPINPELGRNSYAMAELEKAGVTVIMNLADSREEAESYPGFGESYYGKQKVIFLNLGVDFAEKDFQAGLAKGLAFFAENPGIYAVHCTEGKDRAGFVSALLMCFSGASYEEVVEDYMTTYENYYGVEKGSEKYEAIAQSNIVKTLQTAFQVEDLQKADLRDEAEEYMQQIGVSEDHIRQLKSNLGVRGYGNDQFLFVLAGIALLALWIVFIKYRRGRRS